MLKFKARLEKRRFFEQVRFGRKKSKQEIIKWLFWLEERQGITIGTFEQLLQGMEEIIFPVYIKVHLEKKEEYIEKEKLIDVLNSFIGNYHMEVPIYSAVKVNGKILSIKH